MKNQLARAHPLTRVSSRLIILVLFAALSLAAPFHAALAADVPDLGTAGGFAVLGGTAVTLTDSAVIGDVGSPTAVTVTTSTIVGTVYPAGDPIVTAAYDNFLFASDEIAFLPCDEYLPGDLGGLTIEPGVYCVEGASTTTNGTVTLSGSSDDIWIFKIGASGIGALTGTNFTVVMDNGGLPCNVYWWVAQAVTMSTSNFKGNILAGAAATFTGGSLIGRVLTEAGVTMTGTDVFGCDYLAPPQTDEDYCKKYCKDCCKHFWKDCHKPHGKDKNHCNQGVGNGPEDCDPGNSNQGDKRRSNDEWGGKPGDPGRKDGRK